MTRHFVRSIALSGVTLLVASCAPPPSAPGKQAAALATPKSSAAPRPGTGIVPADNGDPNTIKLGSATITAPLWDQDCDGDLAAGSWSPNWCMGNGFNLSDNTGTGTVLPRYYVQSANIHVQLDTTLVDDTSALDIGVRVPDSGIPGCWNGVCCDDSGQNCATVTDYWAKTFEGDKGEYRVRMEAWKPFCGLNKTPNCLDQNPDTYTCFDWSASSQIDPQQPVIPYNSSPDGTRGCWVPTDFFSENLASSGYGPPNAGTAPKNGSVSQTLRGDMQLVQAATFVRPVVTVQLDDTRTGNFPPTWDNQRDDDICYFGQNLGDCLCLAINGDPSGCPTGFQGPFSRWHPRSGGFSYTKAFNPFQVVVIPVALAQLKVTPYTIVYQPPGDFSQATFRVSTSYSVAMSAGNAATTTNTTAVDNSGSVADSMGVSAMNKGEEDKDHNLLSLTGSLGINVSDTTKWDKNTSVGVGRSTTLTNGTSATWSDSYKWTIVDSTLTPGASGAPTNEPFWDDLFVFVVHPQYAFWSDLAGHPTVTMLGALGTAQNPLWFELPVRALDACYRRTPGSGYEDGIEIPDTNGERLNSDDCYQFLQLDPFWAIGQSIPRWTDVTTNDARAQFLTATDYGVPHACATGPQPCGSDLSFTLDEVNTMTTTQGLAVGATFSSAISDMVGSAYSSGFSLGFFGITGGGTFASGETTTTTNKMDFSLTQSVTATSQQSTELIGVLDDHHGLASDKGPSGTGTKYLANTARAYIYRDKLFGSFMYQDKDAPLGSGYALRLTGDDLTVMPGNKFSVNLEAWTLDPAHQAAPIRFTVSVPPGITASPTNPTTVARGGNVTLYFTAAANVPLGSQTLSVTGTSVDDREQASFTFTTTGCVPTVCSHMCGVRPDGCGGVISCSCAAGETCYPFVGICAPTN